MRNSILILLLTLLFLDSYGQNLDGEYIWSGEIIGLKSDYGIVKIEITSDTTYTETNFTGYKSEFDSRKEKWKKEIQKGKIKKDGGFYILTEIGNRKNWYLVKIRRNKLIVYGYKTKKNGKLKKVKGIELKRASLQQLV